MLWDSVVQTWDCLNEVIFIGLIVSKVFIGPSIRSNSDVVSPCMHDFIEEKEHNEGSGIKISDWKFPNEEI